LEGGADIMNTLLESMMQSDDLRIKLLEILAKAQDDVNNGRIAQMSYTFDNIRTILNSGQ
jgi:hypothetical protein